jgi:phosphate starvation-inducible PhoH-like protein
LDQTIQLTSEHDPAAIAGPGERNLKILREVLGVGVTSRDGRVRVRGDAAAVGHAVAVLRRVIDVAGTGRTIRKSELLDLIRETEFRHELMGTGDLGAPPDFAAGFDTYLPGRRIEARTEGQRAYLQAMADHDLTFCAGPAGTGKTYLAVAAAVAMLRAGAVRRIILARPAVEAGEKLGFLPGDMQQKVNPYLRPLLDALHDTMEFAQAQRFLASEIIEVIPLAFMRGRTLNDAAIILDEAQNTTRTQMLMFLTRLGHGGKMVVTGDTSQIDLEDPRDSGLVDAARRLSHVPGVAFATLGRADIVRHSLVQRIVEAYEQDDST